MVEALGNREHGHPPLPVDPEKEALQRQSQELQAKSDYRAIADSHHRGNALISCLEVASLFFEGALLAGSDQGVTANS
jgi:hypothetical protein